MISLRLRRPDLGRPWQWEGGQWRCNESWIRPMLHPALEHTHTAGNSGEVTFCVRERPREVTAPELASFGELDDYVKSLNDVGLEFLLVHVGREETRLVAGVHGTAPLYLAADGSILEGSWDITALSHWCRLDKLVERAIARTLTRRHRYSAETPFTSVSRLTERATATWNGGVLTIYYPSPAPHVAESRSLRAGIDPVEALGALTANVMNRRLWARGVAVELSGGVDSTNVAVTLTAGDRPAVSAGLLLPGASGRLQINRRNIITRSLGLGDIVVTAANHPPFVPGGRRSTGAPHDPTGDFYLEAFQALAEQAAKAGVQVLFTGFGGDEIMAPRPAERAHAEPRPPYVPWLGPTAAAVVDDVDTGSAPVAPVPLPSLMAFAARNPGYLREGIWPVSPLADPLLVRFAESLPLQWRRRKRLLRLRLHRAGMPPEVVRPARPETFLPLMHLGLRRYALKLAQRMLAESLLIDAGYVDADIFRRAVRSFQGTATIPDILYDTVALEVGLRSMVGDQ